MKTRIRKAQVWIVLLAGVVGLAGYYLGTMPHEARANTCAAGSYVCEDQTSTISEGQILDTDSYYAFYVGDTEIPAWGLYVSEAYTAGVYGFADYYSTSAGLKGNTTIGYGVNGQATSGRGVYGYATSGTGVYGYSISGDAGYFNGDVVTTDWYKFSSAKTFYHKVGGFAIIPERDDDVSRLWRRSDYAYVSYFYFGNDYWGSIPIQLPQGAVVKEVKCRLYDNDNSGWIAINLQGVDQNDNMEYLAITGTAGLASQASPRYVTTTSICSYGCSNCHPIANGNCVYRLTTYFVNQTAVGSSYMRFYNCRIKYELTTLKP